MPTAEDIRRRNKENIRTVKKICKEGNFSIAEVHSLAFAITVDNLKAFKTLAKLFQVLTNIQSCDRIDDNGIHLLPEHYVEILEIRFSDAQEVAKEEAMLVKTAFEALRYRAIRIPVLIIQLHHFIPDDDILRTMMFVHRIGCDYLSISTTGDDEGNDDRPYARLTENDILSNELHPLVEDLRLSNATSLFCDKMASWTWALVLGSRLSNLELDNVRFLEGADDMSVFFSNFEAPFLYKLAITRCPVHSQDVVSFLWRHPTIKGLTISHLSSRRDSVPAMVHTGGILPNLVSLSGPARLLACLLDLSAPECSKNLTFLSILSEDGGTDTAGPRMDPTHILLVLERVVKFQTLEHIDLELTGLAGVSELSWLTEAYDVISSSELRRKVTSISKVSISTSKCDVHEREKSLVSSYDLARDNSDTSLLQGDLFSWLKVFPNINQIYVYDTAPRNRPVAHVLQSLIPNGWVVRLDICVEGVEARMFADEYVESHLPWLPVCPSFFLFVQEFLTDNNFITQIKGKTSPVDRCCCVTM